MKTFKHNLLFCLLLVCSESAIAQVSTTLVGKSYSVNLTPTGKNQDHSWKIDTFIFDSSEMYPKGMKKREGFKRASYSPTNIGTEHEPVIKFIYEKNNKYGSSLKIEGTATVDFIEGTATWIDDDGEHTYTFTGSRVITSK
jgi:hypothetical protein